MEMMIILVLAVGVMFLMTNRSRKQQREAQAKLASLTPGQEVMTGSGMFGTVVGVDEENDTVTIETTPGVETKWLRAAIRKIIEADLPDDEPDELNAATIGSDRTVADGEVPEDFEVPDDLSELSDSAVDLDKDSSTGSEDGEEDRK